MSTQLIKTVVATLSLAAVGSAALAQSAAKAAPAAAAPAPPPLSATEQWIKDVKNPTRWLSWGTDLRVRNEYFNNALTLAPQDPVTGVDQPLHEQDYFRFRSRLWASLIPVTNVSINARLANETREWMKPAGYTYYRGNTGLDWRYGIVDNLNIKFKNVLDQPLTVTAGRQDIVFGDYWNWWLVADGTPGDGSWTYFLDSARATYQAEPIKTSLDLIYIYQNPWNDDVLPVINNQRAYLTEQTERGAILYAANKSIKNVQIDGYFFYKQDDATTPTPGLDRWVGDTADIYTLGTRVTGTLAEHWKYYAEGGYQFGNKEDPSRDALTTALVTRERDISAFGVNASLTYMLKDRLSNEFSAVFEHLSGDDPSTGDDEMFDVLWGRWPRYSELYLYSYAAETSGKIGQHNNLRRLGASWKMTPIQGMSLGATYNALFAPQDMPTRTPAPNYFSGDGNFRGHYMQAVLSHKFSSHLVGHLWAEFVWKGDYYSSTELMSFLRGEVTLAF